MAKNWFAKCNTIDTLEKRLRELQFEHHPDRNGNSDKSIKISQEINAQFVKRKYAMENPQPKQPKTPQKPTEAQSETEPYQPMPKTRFFGEKEAESIAETGAKFGSAILKGLARGFARKYNSN